MSLLHNALLTQTSRYAQDFILGILTMPVMKFFAPLDSEENQSVGVETK